MFRYAMFKKRVFSFLVVFVALFSLCFPISVLSAPLYKDTMSVAGLFPWASNWQSSIVRAKNLGFTRGRMDFLWHWVEKRNGIYDFSFYDQVYNTMAANGIRPVFILAYNNTLYGGSNTMNGVSSQANRDAYARFVRAAAEHYKGKGVIWEVWNEPDLSKFWLPSPSPSDYAQLSQAAVTAIRQADPNAYVISAGFGHKYWNREFIRQTLAAGMLRGYNALAVHSYDFLNPPMIIEQQEGLHAQLRQWMSQYNGGIILPILDTEFEAYSNWMKKVASDPYDYAGKQTIRMYLDNYFDGVYMSSVYGMNTGDDLNLLKDTPVTKALVYTNQLLGNCEGGKLDYGAKMRGILFTDKVTGQKIISWWPVEGQQTVSFSPALSVQGVYNVYGQQKASSGQINNFSGSVFDGPMFFVLAAGGVTPTPTPSPSPSPTPTPTPEPTPGPTVPAAPSNLSAEPFLVRRTHYSIRNVKLTWKDNATNETGYEVWRSIYPDRRFSRIKTLGANSVSFTHELGRLPLRNDYYYLVRAYNATGPSPFSNRVKVNRF